jgi:maltokinase
MEGAAPLITTSFASDQLSPWVQRQRWYAGKGRVPVLSRIGGLQLEDPAGEVGIHIHLMLDESGPVPTTYQVPLTSRGTRLSDGDHALVGTVEADPHAAITDGTDPGHGTRYIYDGPHDPVFAAALLALMVDEQDLGVARGRRIPSVDATAATTSMDAGRLLASRVLVGEQSNTSIILDLAGAPDTPGAPSTQLICKLFRVLHHGENPDVVVQSALSAAGSTRVPAAVGYVDGQWPDSAAPGGRAAGHLAFAQEFLPGVEDAWRVALAAVASGADFSDQARSLGLATAQVHAALAEVMGTQEATREDVDTLTRSMRARQAAAVSEVPALVEYDDLVDASIEAMASARWPVLQRIHGDYHLGQVLDAPGRGWVLVDFEGEPLRPLAERGRPDLALRDVAGMLRSFDYASGSWEQAAQLSPGPLSPARSADLAGWAGRARAAFLEGYTTGAGRDPRADPALLDALELDKALYEVVYEARNRPAWLSIPTTAIARLAQSAGRRSDLRS